MTSDHAAASITGDHAADIDRHVRIYITVFVALMALTLVTVAVSYLDLSTPMAIAVALLIATVKGSLVACYFMPLISETQLLHAALPITTFTWTALLSLSICTRSRAPPIK